MASDFDYDGILRMLKAGPTDQEKSEAASTALMRAGLGILAANRSGPTLQIGRPTFLNAVGQGGLAGMDAYPQALSQQMALRRSAAAEALTAMQVDKLRREAQLQQLFSPLLGLPSSNPSGSAPATGVLSQGTQAAPAGILSTASPDRLEALGTYLGMTGHPGGATLMTAADRLRARNEERAAAESFKSRPGILGAGVSTDSEQGRMLLGNTTGDPGFDRAVLAAQNEALNSNTKLPPQPIQAPRPGLFAPLTGSQYVGPLASQLQQQLDATQGVKPSQWLEQFSHLQQQDHAARTQAIAREENAAVRRELASQADTTRRDLAGQSDETRRLLAAMSSGNRDANRQNLEDQRSFANERSLANDYNSLSKDFRTVLPSFQASARYVAGGKYNSSGDRDLAFSFARTLDPKDRVGVNDIRDINKLGNVPERIQQAIVALAEGKELPDRVRREMFDAMRNRFNTMNEQQQQIENEYETRAQQYQLAPNRIVQRFAIRQSAPVVSPAQPAPRAPGAGATRLRFDAQGNLVH